MPSPARPFRQVWFAVESATGTGGISALTCAGPGVDELMAGVFRPAGRGNATPRELAYGHLMQDGEIVDEILCARIPPEESLTGWPTATLTCHGGTAVVAAAARALRKAGARRVTEAAFWRQAVGTKRRDRLQAAAAAALPRATTALSAAILLAQREGAAREAIGRMQDLADGASPSLDPPPCGGRGPATKATAVPAVAEIVTGLRAWRATLPLGQACLAPLRIAIVGAPNAGKSTLLNALAGKSRVVVHEAPGTTRDTVEEPGAIEGVPVTWIDTAGFGAPQGTIDARAQRAGARAARAADLLLVLVESADAASRAEAWAGFVARHIGRSSPPWLPVLTKVDLAADRGPPGRKTAPPSQPVPLRLCAPSDDGLEALRAEILDALAITGVGRGFPPAPGSPVCWTATQSRALGDCLQSVAAAAILPTPKRVRSAVLRALNLLDRRLRWGR
ncbi:MAG: 50S ribosome-binding GTPase [Planctomycetes bacterium]|nr:50S ribosome-binding GTPase [Planctomycetota bacterium]